MKRGITAAALIIASLLIAAGESVCVNADTRAYTQMLDEADAYMQNSEYAEASSAAQRLEHRFNNSSSLYNMFMFHSETQEISSSLAALSRYAYAGDASEYSAASARIRRALAIMRNARKPSAENIL